MKTNNPYPSFDDQLREQMSSLDPAVPEGVWEAMEQSLDAINESLQFDSAIRESIDQINIPAPDGVFQVVQSQLGSGVIGSGLSLAGKWILGSVLAGVVATSVWFVANDVTDLEKETSALVIEQNENSSVSDKVIDNLDTREPNNGNVPDLNLSVPDYEAEKAVVAGVTSTSHPQPYPAVNIQDPALITSAEGTAQPNPQPRPQPQPQPSFSFSASDTMLCAGQIYTFFVSNADNCVYDVLINGITVGQGKRGTEKFQYEAAESGLYHVQCLLRYEDGLWKKTQFLHVNPLPEVKLSKSDLGSGRYTFETKENAKTIWYLDGGKQAGATIQLYDALPKDHKMSAHVTNEFGCSDSASMDFRNNVVFEVKEPVIPNVFSPNGDGKNDVYSIEIEGATHYQIYIFNSESKMVFESRDPKAAWDGKDKFKQNRIESGKYTCVIEYALAGGAIIQKTILIQLIKE